MSRWLLVLSFLVWQAPPARSGPVAPDIIPEASSVRQSAAAPAEAPAGVPAEAPAPRAVSPGDPAAATPPSDPTPVPGRGGCNGAQRVVSSFYYSGRRTASGQLFNPHGLTAAHRTLPFGTRLTVTNPRTGQSVTVTINDRGPFVRGVGLDLSLGAAQAIGMRGNAVVCIL
jgi:rare lipoprotein A